jgi:hypothetical protein
MCPPARASELTLITILALSLADWMLVLTSGPQDNQRLAPWELVSLNVKASSDQTKATDRRFTPVITVEWSM